MARPDCEQVLDQLGLDLDGPRLAEHLASCAACAERAAALRGVAGLARSVLLVEPPPGVVDRAVHAALSTLPPVSTPAGLAREIASTRSPLVYLVAALLFALAASWQLADPLTLLDFVAGLGEPLRLVLMSPAIWLLPTPERLVQQLVGWGGLIVLAWSLRSALQPVGRRGPA